MKPRLRGGAFLARFCDDFVMVFDNKSDADRVFAVLPARFEKFGLTVHEGKTRLVDFRRPPYGGRAKKGKGDFDFLGFRHYWGRSRRDKWVVKQKTASSRLAGAVKKIKAWCKSNRHEPVREQQIMLAAKLRGHYNYYGITCNYKSLRRFYLEVRSNWRKWLNRRSRKAKMTWEKMTKLLERYPLPGPKVVHSVVK